MILVVLISFPPFQVSDMFYYNFIVLLVYIANRLSLWEHKYFLYCVSKPLLPTQEINCTDLTGSCQGADEKKYLRSSTY